MIIMQEIKTSNFNDDKMDLRLHVRAFELSDNEKIKIIESHYAEIMRTLGLNLNDDSLKGTPKRVAKMFVKELFSGLNPENKPVISLFENKYHYHKMITEKDITLYSNCEHHFVPIIGKVHVAYVPAKQVIGLSKINRLVQFYAKRPQVQERLTVQILESLQEVLGHKDVMVMIEADHLCVASRGIKDTNSKTVTYSFAGQFEDKELRQEFFATIQYNK